MSNTGGKKIAIWDGAIEYYESAPHPRAEAVRSVIKEAITSFERHKQELLTILRKVCERRPKSQHFNEDETWQILTSCASTYSQRRAVKRQRIPDSERREDLSDIQKALGKARHLVNAATHNEVGDDLLLAWSEEVNELLLQLSRNADGSCRATRLKDVLDQILNDLSVLEAAAARAAKGVCTKGGRPKGTAVLRPDEIEELAGVYRKATGSIPGAGDGPFAEFVMAFLTALGRGDDIGSDSMVEAIKEARLWSLSLAGGRNSVPSPFSENGR